MGVKFGMEEGTFSMPIFTPIGATCRPCGAQKPQNRPLSKPNTGRFALRAMLPVKIILHCCKQEEHFTHPRKTCSPYLNNVLTLPCENEA